MSLRTQNRISLVAYGTIGLTALAVACGSAVAQMPETIRLPGTVRDFHKDDAGFAVTPNGGNGHYAGNVGLTIGDDAVPTFTGTGFRVASQWRNAGLDPIPPHLFVSGSPAGGIVTVVNLPTINNHPTIDSFDSSIGPYGGANVGPEPNWVQVQASDMPVLSAPSPLPPLSASVEYKGNKTATLNNNLYCNTFRLRNNCTLEIEGDIFIYCTTSFRIENHTTLNLKPNATLTIYVAGSCEFENNVDVNVNTWTPSRLRIINLGNQPIEMNNHVEVYAQIISPNAPLDLQNNCDFCGNFTGQCVLMANSAGFHNDGSGVVVPSMCGAPLNDTAGVAGVASTGGIPSAAAFSTWFRDVLGTNVSYTYVIELIKNEGVYEYLNDSFFPIDGQLFGNEGQAHNYYFTYAINARFVHRACQNTFFEFYGADDAWLFVDGKLAMDLGGVMPLTAQHVELDRIEGLVDGQTYTIQFFFAQRQSAISVFRLRTNLDLVQEPSPITITAAFD